MSLVSRKFLKSLTDPDLLSRTDSLVREERRISIELLHYFREVESRMLFAQRGFSSMYAFLTDHLLYSNGAAHRRLEAMHALKDLPELEEALQEGRLNLTTAAQVQVFLKQESARSHPYTQEARRELFEQAQGLSVRETEKLLVSISPESALPRDREREVAPGKTEITFVADDELMQMLKRLRELTSHTNPSQDYQALFKRLAGIALEKMDPEKKQARGEAKKAVRASKVINAKDIETAAAKAPSVTEPSVTEPSVIASSAIAPSAPAPGNFGDYQSGISRARMRSAIPATLHREIWVRDGGECQFLDSVTGRKCCSKFQPEIEHIMPIAAGGGHDRANLEVLCKTHNQLRALQWFGKAKMGKFLPKLS